MSILNIIGNTENHVYGFQVINFGDSDRSLVGLQMSTGGLVVQVFFINIIVF